MLPLAASALLLSVEALASAPFEISASARYEQGALAVDVRIGPARVDVLGRVEVTLTSQDGSAHRVRLQLLPPPGFNVLDAPHEIAVPAFGQAVVPLRLLRGAAARGQAYRIQVVASPVDGPFERAALASGELEVVSDPALLPRLRAPLAVGGALLLIVAAAFEMLGRRQAAP